MVRVVTMFDDSPERALETLLEMACGGPDDLRQANELAALLRTYLATCSCWNGNYEDYEGPQASCSVHGAVRAFNSAVKELEDLRTRVKSARDRASSNASTGYSGEARNIHRHYVKQFSNLIRKEVVDEGED